MLQSTNSQGFCLWPWVLYNDYKLPGRMERRWIEFIHHLLLYFWLSILLSLQSNFTAVTVMSHLPPTPTNEDRAKDDKGSFLYPPTTRNQNTDLYFSCPHESWGEELRCSSTNVQGQADRKGQSIFFFFLVCLTWRSSYKFSFKPKRFQWMSASRCVCLALKHMWIFSMQNSKSSESKLKPYYFVQ